MPYENILGSECSSQSEDESYRKEIGEVPGELKYGQKIVDPIFQ